MIFALFFRKLCTCTYQSVLSLFLRLVFCEFTKFRLVSLFQVVKFVNIDTLVVEVFCI